MLLTVTRSSDTRLKIELVEQDEGTTIYQNMINRYKEKDIKFIAKLADKTVPEVTQLLNSICDTEVNGEYQTQEIEVYPPHSLIESMLQVAREPKAEIPDTSTFTVTVREIASPRKFGVDYNDPEPGEALKQAFNVILESSIEPLIEWDGKDKLCCLDVDYHYVDMDKRPSYDELKRLVSKIKPQPFCWHPSHKKGAKLYYIYKPGFTADELAAVAGVNWITLDPRATFDLIKSTRHPCYRRTFDNTPPPLQSPDEIIYSYGNGDLSSIRKLLLSDVEQSDIDDLLAEKGWKVGDVLPHTECLVSPNNDPKKNVFIGEKGVFCHRCQALGLGNKNNPGFVSYASMIGGSDNRIATMVKNFCHLEHARVVLSTIFPSVPNPILDTVYRIMLKIIHTPDDPRIRLAMVSGTGFVRSKGQWVTSDGTTIVADNKQNFIKSLPSVLIPGDTGYSLNVAKMTALCNSGDVTEYGYPDVTFIRGCKIYGIHLPQRTDEIVRTIIRKEFADCKPTYLPQSKRMSENDFWGLIESEFPGIDKNYLMLLIAAKGASEGRMCQCPFILVTGPSGSGKSTTPHIAAGIVGDKAEEPIWHPHPERFRASLMDAARESSYVVINEIFKSADQAKLTHVQALNPMLSLTEDSRSHVLYVGSVPFGRLPLFILTDVDTPKEVEQDIQIARRFTYFRLNSRINWEDTLVSKGIRPHQFRLLSGEHALAADSLLSYIVDRFFSAPTSLKAIANELTAIALEEYSDEGDRKTELLKEFYKEVCAAPKLDGSDLKRYSGPGWKRIDRIKTNRLNDVWMELCDGPAPDKWQLSRLITSEDWGTLLGTPFPVMCDVRPYQGSTIYVRFRDSGNPRYPMWLNGKDYG